VFGVWLKTFGPFTAVRTFLLHGSIVNEVLAGFNSKNCKIDGPDFCKTFALNPSVSGIKLRCVGYEEIACFGVGVSPWRDRKRIDWRRAL
jgi:hypothetical protein